jgi:GNAT superfamily N-acetyltransferase
LQLAAWSADGRLAATAEAYVGEDGYRYIDRAESFIFVDPAYRRQSLGTRLALEVERFARNAKARWLEAICYERDLSTANPFVLPKGFREIERYRESVQDPSRVDVSSLERLRARLSESGIRTVPFSEIDSQTARRQLYRCAMEIERDMPHEAQVDWHDSPFDIWIRKVLEAPGASADAIFTASDEDRIVGLTYLVLRGDGEAEVGDTGVIRSHRRRGIARALKLMATRYAAEHAIPRVHTDNRTDNAGMLALNTQLGFVPGEAIVIFEKTLTS